MAGTSAPHVHRTGFAALDDAYEITLEAGREPDWIDIGVAEALAPFARRGASVEVNGGTVVVRGPLLDPAMWDELLADGEHLAASLARPRGT